MPAKTIAFLRHGEALPAQSLEGDHGRVLSETGRKQVLAQGKRWLRGQGVLEYIVSSDASRTLETARIFSAALGCSAQIKTAPALYGASLSSYVEVIAGLPAHVHHVLLVAHMPGVWEVSAWLLQNAHFIVGTQGFPPAAMVKMTLPCATWSVVEAGCATLQAFVLP